MSSVVGTPPRVKGWCPGAWQPMQSGDGYILRIRPQLARFDRVQTLGLCQVAERFGNGQIELTSRANLQLRGLAEDSLAEAQALLADLGMLDDDPNQENRRNILMTPFWEADDRSVRLYKELVTRLEELPELPAKFGFAVDTGEYRWLAEAPADIRLEPAEKDRILLRPDGINSGIEVDEASAIDKLIELANWFATQIQRGGVNPALPTIKRMAKLVKSRPMPKTWTNAPTLVGRDLSRRPGSTPIGPAIGLPFGSIHVSHLRAVLDHSQPSAIRLTPWRCLVLEHGKPVSHPAILSDPNAPLLSADACPGAPSCPHSSVETRALARDLAGRLSGSLHVSGCAKGCARARSADTTLVGRNGRFDLVLNGAPWDEPQWRNLTPETVIQKLS